MLHIGASARWQRGQPSQRPDAFPDPAWVRVSRSSTVVMLFSVAGFVRLVGWVEPVELVPVGPEVSLWLLWSG